MAEVLEDFKFYRSKGSAQYPWSEWLEGQIRKLERGKDWNPEITSQQFQTQCHVAGTKNSVKVRTETVTSQFIYIQAYIPD